MADHPRLGELLCTNRLANDDLEAAVSAYLADPTPGPREIAQNVTLDIAAAVPASSYAR
ncbi:hypothetical protein [Methylobacterium oryzisoli]|uniref:hypothetical protein n=1 Tax=Methylobacterium oryzisoli TaxID=3385502 RepID=UPI0038912160